MKEKATYRRFDLLSFLAILGCIGMLFFECIFIFELYDRAPDQVAVLLPVQPASTVSPSNLPAIQAPVEKTEPVPVVEKSAPAITNAPASTNPAPAEIETAPAAAPVG